MPSIAHGFNRGVWRSGFAKKTVETVFYHTYSTISQVFNAFEKAVQGF